MCLIFTILASKAKTVKIQKPKAEMKKVRRWKMQLKLNFYLFGGGGGGVFPALPSFSSIVFFYFSAFNFSKKNKNETKICKPKVMIQVFLFWLENYMKAKNKRLEMLKLKAKFQF